MNIYKTVGGNIRKHRLKKEMTQTDLAVEAGVDRSFLAKIELGQRNFTLGILQNIAGALNLGIKDLLDGVK